MRGRVILLVVLVLVVVGVVAALLLLGGGDDSTTDATATLEGGAVVDPNATPITSENTNQTDQTTPIPSAAFTAFAPVVIAVQDLPRGFRLTEQFLTGSSPAVTVVNWPVESIPETGFQSVEQLRNTLVRSDIPRESPIVAAQVVQDPAQLAQVGSDAALLLEEGQVAIAMPLDVSGVSSIAYGLQPGDYVDVIFSFLFVEVDETFQSRQPNGISVITRNELGELVFGTPLEGRPEPSPLSALGVLVSPSERQRPRLVTQRTVTGAQVIYVGYFPPDGKILGLMTATPTPFETPTPAPEGQQQQASAPTPAPTATPFLPVIVTLGVDPQDALVLTWALDAQIPVTYILRAADDPRDAVTPTTAVTLQYLIENYSISQPPILPFALEPAIDSLRSNQLDIFSVFAEAPQDTRDTGGQ